MRKVLILSKIVAFILLLITLIGSYFGMATKVKVAIVTGSNKGIGFEIARGLVNDGGFRVLMACRNEELGRSAAAELGAEFCGPLDICSSESIENFPAALKKLSVDRVDVLINNAAMAFKGADPTPHNDQAEPTLKGNTFGTITLTKTLLPLMKGSNTGGKSRIINVASFAGGLKILKNKERRLELDDILSSASDDRLVSWCQEFVKDTSNGDQASKGWPTTNYGFSKLAIIAYTKILARQEPEILVNAVCPGWCATSMSSHRGPRSAAKGAETPLFLAKSSTVTDSGNFYQDLEKMEW